jgi:hypothetical protein
MTLQSRVPSPRTWAVCDMVVKVVSPIVTSCVLNQSHGHWLFGDAVQFVITKAHEFCDDIVNLIVPNSMGDPKASIFDAKLENSQFT